METDDCILVPAAQFSNDHRAIRIAVIPASLMGMHLYIVHIHIYIQNYTCIQTEKHVRQQFVGNLGNISNEPWGIGKCESGWQSPSKGRDGTKTCTDTR